MPVIRSRGRSAASAPFEATSEVSSSARRTTVLRSPSSTDSSRSWLCRCTSGSSARMSVDREQRLAQRARRQVAGEQRLASAAASGARLPRRPESCARPATASRPRARASARRRAKPVERVVVDPVALARHAVLDRHRSPPSPRRRRARSSRRAAATPSRSWRQRPQPGGGLVDLVVGDDQRRLEADRRRTSRVDDKPLFEQRSPGQLGGIDLRLTSIASIRPRPRTAATYGSVASPNASRSPATRTRASRSGSEQISSATSADDATTGPPANVEP